MGKKIVVPLLVLCLGMVLGIVAYEYILDDHIGPGARNAYRDGAVFNLNIRGADKAFSGVVKAVSPSVVNIATKKRPSPYKGVFPDDPLFDFFSPFGNKGVPGGKRERSLGSGVIISKDGFIITNYHVIENADEIKVTLFNRMSYKGEIIGTDPKTDIAVVRIDPGDLPAAAWGNSDSLQVGEFVLAIGNAFGLNNTVTMGIISAVGRANVGIADYEDFIQTDAAINPGNSGGPLVNAKGELIGINTAIFSRSGGYQGIGFAVPSNMARSVFNQLVSNGKVVRGWIGVTIQNMNAELARNFGLKNADGALVSGVIKDGPAETAGVKRGDVIVAVNDKEIRNVSAVRNMVAQSPLHKKINIKALRGGKVKQFEVTVLELPGEYTETGLEIFEESDKKEVLGGIDVLALRRDIARQLGLASNTQGVVVSRIAPGSPADDAGIRKGDIIQEIDDRPIRSLRDFEDALSLTRRRDHATLFIHRNGKRFYVVLNSS